MQHEQLNFKRGALAAVLLLAGLWGADPARSASPRHDEQPDPILSGGPVGPCDPQTASADVTGGVDVNGQPVTAAELDRAPVPVPGQIELPVRTGRGKAYVTAGGKSLDPLLNPPPGCAPPQKPR